LNVPLSHMYPAIANVPYTIVDAHATRYQPRTVRVRRQRPKTEVRARASDFLLRSRFCTSHIISAASRSVSEWAVHECQWAVRGSIIVRPALLSAASGTAPESPVLYITHPAKGGPVPVLELSPISTVGGWWDTRHARGLRVSAVVRACSCVTSNFPAAASTWCRVQTSQVSVHVQTGPTEPFSRTARRPERCQQQQPPKPRRIPPRTSPRWLPPSLCHPTAPS